MPAETARLDRHSCAVDQYSRLLMDCKVRWQWLALPCTLPQTFPLLVGSSLPHTRQCLAVFIGQGELPSKCENRASFVNIFQFHTGAMRRNPSTHSTILENDNFSSAD